VKRRRREAKGPEMAQRDTGDRKSEGSGREKAQGAYGERNGAGKGEAVDRFYLESAAALFGPLRSTGARPVAALSVVWLPAPCS
jgi:hypothetical protein